MSNLMKSALAAMLAAMAMTCAGATPASATTMDGGAFTLTSTNLTWAVHGLTPITCVHSTISGTAPAGSATFLSVPVTMTVDGCSAFGFTYLVTFSEACHTAATSPRLVIMHNQVAAPQASAQIILPAGCDIRPPDLGGCNLLITGGRTIGNGTAGAGGLGWTNAAPKSSVDVSGALIAGVHNSGIGALCQPPGTASETLFGTFTVSSATNVTVTP